MNKQKVYLQCGFEDECETNDCLNCPRKEKITKEVTVADSCIIEDFAMIDLPIMIKEKPKIVDLMQDVSRS